MKIIDSFCYAKNNFPTPESLLKHMSDVSIRGSCVFSSPPKFAGIQAGKDFKNRLSELCSLTSGYENRLFPILWIHPDEENISKNLQQAVDAGICGFLMVCSDFYVYEEKSMTLLRQIAQLNKPVFFESGILWDTNISSKYSKPLNWEALLSIPNLRFSLCDCGWPWVDECIALLLKSMYCPDHTAQMFVNISNRIPAGDREKLLNRLYTAEHNIYSNILFGTGTNTTDYCVDSISSRLKDEQRQLLDLGVSQENIEKLYAGNLLRFLGKSTETEYAPTSFPSSPSNPAVKEVMLRWFLKLNFPGMYYRPFVNAMERIPISDALTPENYNWSCSDGQRNLLSMMYMCEGLSKQYAARGIPENILMDTLSDIVRWLEVWSDIKSDLYLGELSWLKEHMLFHVFQLGRLHFRMGTAKHNIPEANVLQGDPVLEIHIPDTGPLKPEECDKSIAMAKDFFAKYFPEFHWKVFTCHSWLLDDTLEQLLPSNSNILKFQRRFTIVEKRRSDDILGFVFRWQTSRGQVKNRVADTSFAQAVKTHIRKNGDFYSVLGYIPRDI